MYKKKRRICVAWLLGMMLLLCACGNLETGKDQGEVAENDKIQIGMSFDSFVIERWQRDRDIFGDLQHIGIGQDRIVDL